MQAVDLCHSHLLWLLLESDPDPGDRPPSHKPCPLRASPVSRADVCSPRATAVLTRSKCHSTSWPFADGQGKRGKTVARRAFGWGHSWACRGSPTSSVWPGAVPASPGIQHLESRFLALPSCGLVGVGLLRDAVGSSPGSAGSPSLSPCPSSVSFLPPVLSLPDREHATP